ncbi:MAG: LysO family transporter [Muribaculaceae bacterium]|nr:LysO family transporter [Muribaculaceae bacterium]
MLKIVAIMFCGIGAGFLLRKHPLPWLSKLIMLLIWLLLFFLGVAVGQNERIIKGLNQLGLDALLLAFAGIGGSVVLAWVLWRVVARGKGGRA